MRAGLFFTGIRRGLGREFNGLITVNEESMTLAVSVDSASANMAVPVDGVVPEPAELSR